MSTSKLNTENIFRYVYDPGTQSLRTGIVATLPPGTIDISIDDTTDSIKVGDGTGNYLHVNPDGSVNVNVVTTSTSELKNLYSEIAGVVSGVTSELISYTALPNTKLLRCEFGGDNIAQYTLSIGGVTQAKKLTYFLDLNGTMDFLAGISVNTGDLIEIEVVHDRPANGSFFCNIIVES